jgi:purine-binding chemotaxis protein CheW
MDLTQTADLAETKPFTPEDQFVIFSLDRNDFALPVGIIDRIIRSVNITVVPGAKEIILGMINIHGQVIPVFNIRKIFNLSSRDIKLGDLYILIRMSGQTISIVVDSVKGITNRKNQKIIPAGKIFPGMEKILEGLIFFEDGMILIYNPEKLFTLEGAGKIDIEVLEQKIKEVHDTGSKASRERQKQEKAEVKRGKVEKKNRKTKRNKK